MGFEFFNVQFWQIQFWIPSLSCNSIIKISWPSSAVVSSQKISQLSFFAVLPISNILNRCLACVWLSIFVSDTVTQEHEITLLFDIRIFLDFPTELKILLPDIFWDFNMLMRPSAHWRWWCTLCMCDFSIIKSNHMSSLSVWCGNPLFDAICNRNFHQKCSKLRVVLKRLKFHRFEGKFYLSNCKNH